MLSLYPKTGLQCLASGSANDPPFPHSSPSSCFTAAVADELAKQDGRKTVSVNDVMGGLRLMEFPDDIAEEVRKELKAFRNTESAKKAAALGRKEANAANASGDVGAGADEEEEDDEDEEDEATREMRADEGEREVVDTQPLDLPPARPGGEADVDEEDEDTEQRMVAEGVEDEDENEDEDEDMAERP